MVSKPKVSSLCNVMIMNYRMTGLESHVRSLQVQVERLGKASGNPHSKISKPVATLCGEKILPKEKLSIPKKYILPMECIATDMCLIPAM